MKKTYLKDCVKKLVCTLHKLVSFYLRLLLIGENVDDEIIDNVKEEWRAHWGVKCNMCERVFAYKAEFDQHYVESYSLPPVYTCSFCNKTSDKYSTFRSHCYRHITEGRYK